MEVLRMDPIYITGAVEKGPSPAFVAVLVFLAVSALILYILFFRWIWREIRQASETQKSFDRLQQAMREEE